MKNNWKKILNELSYRVSSGIPDLTNEQHLMKLWDILKEHKWPVDARVELLRNLEEAVGKVYVQKGSGPEGAKIQIGPKGGRYYIGDKKTGKPAEEPKKKKEKSTKSNKLNQSVEKLLSGETASRKKYLDYMTDDDKKLMKEFDNDMSEFLKNPTEESAKKMIEKYGLEKSTAKSPKLYIRNISFEARKVLGDSGNTATKAMIDAIEEVTGEPLKTENKSKGPKQKVVNSTKNNLGDPSDAANDEGVAKIFDSFPYNTDEFKSSFKKVFGPKDKDGKLLKPSNKNIKEYLNQSINENDSLDNTIKTLEELEQSDNVSPELRKAVQKYKDTLQNVLENSKLPSAEASKAIDNAYAEMAESMYAVSPSIADGMLKNMAEMAFYNSELAKGDEVYLPSAGSFPGADKLINKPDGAGGEKIAGISIKYGKKQKLGAVGFPTEIKQLALYQEDRFYRENMSSRPGESGFATGVSDELIDSDEQLDRVYSESGLDDVIKDKKVLNEALREYKEFMINMQNEYDYKGKTPPADVKKMIRDKEKELMKKVESSLDMDSLTEMVGKDNVSQLLKTPGALVSGGLFFATLKANEGIQNLTQYSQHIENGKLIQKEYPFSSDPKAWKYTHRSIEDRAGGLIASMNPERIKETHKEEH